jgi:single-strand DNA-binding protein
MSVRSLNKVMLIGNLTRDPNLRYTPSSTAVCSFGLATNRSWTPSDGGERQERVDFHNVVSWSKLAEICGQILHKGDKVYVEGRVQTRDWKTDDGLERKVTEIVIDNMMLLHSANGRSYSANNDKNGRDDSQTGSANDDDDKPVAKAPAKETITEEAVTEAVDVSDEIPF